MQDIVRLAVAGLAVALAGCTPHQQYRDDFGAGRLGPFESVFPGKEEAHQPAWKAGQERVAAKVFEQYDEYLLAHVEFDDQGQFWERRLDGEHNQLDALEDRVLRDVRGNRAKYRNGAVMVVFVHGWNNNSSARNGNLNEFRKVLRDLARDERRGRPVIGVYLSWRGKRTVEVPGASKVAGWFSYWDRKETAQNIGQRTMGETLKRLSVLKDEIVEEGEGRSSRTARSRLVVIGHSFGAAAVFSGVSRFFEDELIEVKRSNYRRYIGRNWDLVVLVNPAFEALQYRAIHRYNSQIPPDAPNPFVHLPRLLVVGAEDDGATGGFLPLGQVAGDLFRPRQTAAHLDQPRQMRTALGHYDPFKTHRLVLTGESPNSSIAKLETYRRFENLTHDGRAFAYQSYAPDRGQAALRRFETLFVESEQVKRVLPCMVVEAEPGVIGGHNGIWQPELRNFVIDFIAARERAVQALGQ